MHVTFSADLSDDRSTRSGRSEEHTSELQSPCNLVCRLLLEKKTKQISQECEFYEMFSAQGFDKGTIVTTYKPYPSDIISAVTVSALTVWLTTFDISHKMLHR